MVAAVTVKIPSRPIVVVYIELVHKDPFKILLAELLSDPFTVYIYMIVHTTALVFIPFI